MAGAEDRRKIREAFAAYFKPYSIELSPSLQPSGGVIKQHGWDIRYTLVKEGGRSCLELYAMHRMTNDRHLKIYDDGTVETLPTVSDNVIYDPDVSGDQERAQRERKARDAPLIADLEKKGLW